MNVAPDWSHNAVNKIIHTTCASTQTHTKTEFEPCVRTNAVKGKDISGFPCFDHSLNKSKSAINVSVGCIISMMVKDGGGRDTVEWSSLSLVGD